MNDEHREILRKKRDKFLKDLDAKRAASKLYSRGIFSEEDKDEVNAKKTNYQQREEVLDILPRKGPKAFLVFCDILHEIAEHLEAELRPVQEEGKIINFCSLDERKISVRDTFNIYAKALTVFSTTVVILRHQVSQPKIFDLGHLFNLTHRFGETKFLLAFKFCPECMAYVK